MIRIGIGQLNLPRVNRFTVRGFGRSAHGRTASRAGGESEGIYVDWELVQISSTVGEWGDGAGQCPEGVVLYQTI